MTVKVADDVSLGPATHEFVDSMFAYGGNKVMKLLLLYIFPKLLN